MDRGGADEGSEVVSHRPIIQQFNNSMNQHLGQYLGNPIIQPCADSPARSAAARPHIHMQEEVGIGKVGDHKMLR